MNLPTGAKEIKFITDHRFVWVVYDKKGKTLANAGGTYVFSGQSLVEHLEFADSGDHGLTGKDQPLTIKFEGDTFISFGVLSNGIKIMEKWKRLDR